MGSTNQRNLNNGENGIWKSWLKLLEEEEHTSNKSIFLHIIEDDAKLSEEFIGIVSSLQEYIVGSDMIFTDMYVNPSVYTALASKCIERKRKNQIQVIDNYYTGCLSSVIIPRHKIGKIRKILSSFYSNRSELIPLDNAIRRLISEKKLKTLTVLPFLTGVTTESIEHSTIQQREDANNLILKTQIFCSHLREELNIINSNKNRCAELLNLTSELVKAHEYNNNYFLQAICNFVVENKILVYKQESRLRGEPDYDQ